MVVSVFQVFAVPMVCPKMYLIAAALSLQVSTQLRQLVLHSTVQYSGSASLTQKSITANGRSEAEF